MFVNFTYQPDDELTAPLRRWLNVLGQSPEIWVRREGFSSIVRLSWQGGVYQTIGEVAEPTLHAADAALTVELAPILTHVVEPLTVDVEAPTTAACFRHLWRTLTLTGPQHGLTLHPQ